jgi:hypothetical protein
MATPSLLTLTAVSAARACKPAKTVKAATTIKPNSHAGGRM